MPNPFSDKAGVKKSNPFTADKKPNPFSNSEPTENEIRNRMTGKDRAKALRAADKAARAGSQAIQNPSNPWVAQAHDISAKVAEIDAHIATTQKDYQKSLKAANRAKTLEDINDAFDISDRLMNTVLGYCAQRKRLVA